MPCVLVLHVAPQLVEPDDYAYQASIIAMTQGHFVTLSGAYAAALAGQLGDLSAPAGMPHTPDKSTPEPVDMRTAGDTRDR